MKEIPLKAEVIFDLDQTCFGLALMALMYACELGLWENEEFLKQVRQLNQMEREEDPNRPARIFKADKPNARHLLLNDERFAVPSLNFLPIRERLRQDPLLHTYLGAIPNAREGVTALLNAAGMAKQQSIVYLTARINTPAMYEATVESLKRNGFPAFEKTQIVDTPYDKIMYLAHQNIVQAETEPELATSPHILVLVDDSAKELTDAIIKVSTTDYGTKTALIQAALRYIVIVGYGSTEQKAQALHSSVFPLCGTRVTHLPNWQTNEVESLISRLSAIQQAVL